MKRRVRPNIFTPGALQYLGPIEVHVMRFSLAVLALAAAVAAPMAAQAADYPDDDYGFETRTYERERVVHRRVVVEEPIEEEIVIRRPRAVVVAPGFYVGRPGWGYGRRAGYYRGGYGYGRGYGFRGGRYAGYRGGGLGHRRGRW